MSIDNSQIRNFKDFLQLYNKVTELCFSSCVENFFHRNLSSHESTCIEKCVGKFANVNHKMLGVYVELQSEITNRRVAEFEAQQLEARQKSETESINLVAPENFDSSTDSSSPITAS